MNKTKAKIKYKANSFEIIKEGDYVFVQSQKRNIYKRFKLLEC